MNEEQESQKSLGFRGHNIEEFLEAFNKLGYELKSDEKLNVINTDAFWDDTNELNKNNFRVILDSKTGVLHLVPASINPEEYEKLAEQLAKGEKAQAELQEIREKNSELENRIQQIQDELHGTKTGIKGLESQKETEEKALDALRNELAVLKEQKIKLDTYIADTAPKKDALDKEIEEKEAIKQGLEGGIESARQEVGRVTQEHNDRLKRKEEIDQYIQDKDPAVQAIEKEIADITEERDKAKKELEEEQDALKRAEASSAEERAELEGEYNQRSARMVERVKRQRENSRKRRKKIAELDQKIADKKADLELLSQKEEEPAPAGKPVDVTESKEYQALQKQLQDRTVTVRKMLGTVLALEPGAQLDGAVLTDFYKKIAELKKKEDPEVFVALNTLCAKLDEVAAEVLEQEPESAEPDAKDSAIARFWGGVKSAKDSAVTAIFRRKQEEQGPEEQVDNTLEMSNYLGMLDKILSAVKAYKAQVAGYKQAAENAGAGARQAKAAPAGLDEKAETLLNDLSDAVADVPDADELADSAFIKQYVLEVRRCAFELYSIAASRDPEVMYFVLNELAGSAFDDGKKAEAESYAARARDLCSEKLPDSLKEAEENLDFYRAELEK